jgi:predicted AAA+ superfamily ATPase
MEIKRSNFDVLCKELEKPEILVLIGPRQVGKTTLLRALQRHAHYKGLRTGFFDLEQPSHLHTL